MVTVWASLRVATGDRAGVEVVAGNVRERLDRLAERYPALRPQPAREDSVSIGGVIHSDAWLAPIGPDSEFVLLPRIAGG